jgi:hypothetical protein
MNILASPREFDGFYLYQDNSKTKGFPATRIKSTAMTTKIAHFHLLTQSQVHNLAKGAYAFPLPNPDPR